jgi:hypothetical protein
VKKTHIVLAGGALALAVGLGPAAFSGSAATCPQEGTETTPHSTWAAVPNPATGTNTEVYASGPITGIGSTTGGYVGVAGGTGYIEGKGSATGGGSVRGASDRTEADGNPTISSELAVSTTGSVSLCVRAAGNERTVP